MATEYEKAGSSSADDKSATNDLGESQDGFVYFVTTTFHTLLNGIQWILFGLHQDTSVSAPAAITSIMIETFQWLSFAFFYNSDFPWESKWSSWIITAVRWSSNFLGVNSSGFYASCAWIGCLILLALSAVYGHLLLGWKWTMTWFRTFLRLSCGVMFFPLAGSFLRMIFGCVSTTGLNSHIYYSDMSCNSPLHYALTALSVVLLVFYLAVVLIVTLCFFEVNPNQREDLGDKISATSRAHAWGDVLNIICRAVLLFCFILFTQFGYARWPLSLAIVSVGVLLVGTQWRWLPYYHESVQAAAMFQALMVLWSGICFAFANIRGESDRGPLYLIFFSIPILLVVSLLLVRSRSDQILHYSTNRLTSAWLIEVRARLMLRDGIHKLGLDVSWNELDKDSVKVAHSRIHDEVQKIYKLGFARFPNEPYLHLHLSCYYQFYKLNKPLAFRELTVIESLPFVFDVGFFVFLMRRRAEIDAVNGTRTNSSSASVQAYIDFKTRRMRADNAARIAARSLYDFWTELIRSAPNVERLIRLGVIGRQAILTAQHNFEKLLEINAQSVPVLRAFGGFVLDFHGDISTSSQLLHRADEVEDSRASISSNDITELKFNTEQRNTLDIFDERNAVVSVSVDESSFCKVLSANASAREMFGYNSASEIVGKNVNIFIPEPIASIHDEIVGGFMERNKSNLLNTTRLVLAVHRSGSVFPINLNARWADNAASKLIGVMSPLKTEDEQVLYNTTTDNVTYVTRNLYSTFGITREMIVAKEVRISRLIPHLDPTRTLTGKDRRRRELLLTRAHSTRGLVVPARMYSDNSLFLIRIWMYSVHVHTEEVHFIRLSLKIDDDTLRSDANVLNFTAAEMCGQGAIAGSPEQMFAIMSNWAIRRDDAVVGPNDSFIGGPSAAASGANFDTYDTSAGSGGYMDYGGQGSTSSSPAIVAASSPSMNTDYAHAVAAATATGATAAAARANGASSFSCRLPSPSLATSGESVLGVIGSMGSPAGSPNSTSSHFTSGVIGPRSDAHAGMSPVIGPLSPGRASWNNSHPRHEAESPSLSPFTSIEGMDSAKSTSAGVSASQGASSSRRRGDSKRRGSDAHVQVSARGVATSSSTTASTADLVSPSQLLLVSNIASPSSSSRSGAVHSATRPSSQSLSHTVPSQSNSSRSGHPSHLPRPPKAHAAGAAKDTATNRAGGGAGAADQKRAQSGTDNDVDEEDSGDEAGSDRVIEDDEEEEDDDDDDDDGDLEANGDRVRGSKSDRLSASLIHSAGPSSSSANSHSLGLGGAASRARPTALSTSAFLPGSGAVSASASASSSSSSSSKQSSYFTYEVASSRPSSKPGSPPLSASSSSALVGNIDVLPGASKRSNNNQRDSSRALSKLHSMGSSVSTSSPSFSPKSGSLPAKPDSSRMPHHNLHKDEDDHPTPLGPGTFFRSSGTGLGVAGSSDRFDSTGPISGLTKAQIRLNASAAAIGVSSALKAGSSKRQRHGKIGKTSSASQQQQQRQVSDILEDDVAVASALNGKAGSDRSNETADSLGNEYGATGNKTVVAFVVSVIDAFRSRVIRTQRLALLVVASVFACWLALELLSSTNFVQNAHAIDNLLLACHRRSVSQGISTATAVVQDMRLNVVSSASFNVSRSRIRDLVSALSRIESTVYQIDTLSKEATHYFYVPSIPFRTLAGSTQITRIYNLRELSEAYLNAVGNLLTAPISEFSMAFSPFFTVMYNGLVNIPNAYQRAVRFYKDAIPMVYQELWTVQIICLGVALLSLLAFVLYEFRSTLSFVEEGVLSTSLLFLSLPKPVLKLLQKRFATALKNQGDEEEEETLAATSTKASNLDDLAAEGSESDVSSLTDTSFSEETDVNNKIGGVAAGSGNLKLARNRVSAGRQVPLRDMLASLRRGVWLRFAFLFVFFFVYCIVVALLSNSSYSTASKYANDMEASTVRQVSMNANRYYGREKMMGIGHAQELLQTYKDLEQYMEALPYGDASLGLTGQPNAKQTVHLFDDSCSEATNSFVIPTVVRENFNANCKTYRNGVVSRGLQEALLVAFTLAQELQDNKYDRAILAAKVPLEPSDVPAYPLHSAMYNASHALIDDYDQLVWQYLDPLLVMSTELYHEAALDANSSFQTFHTIFFIACTIALVVIYGVLIHPIFTSLSDIARHSASLFLVIPPDVVLKVPQISRYIQEAQSIDHMGGGDGDGKVGGEGGAGGHFSAGAGVGTGGTAVVMSGNGNRIADASDRAAIASP